MFFDNAKMQISDVCCDGCRVSVRGDHLLFVQYKNHYVYGKSMVSPHMCVRL